MQGRKPRMQTKVREKSFPQPDQKKIKLPKEVRENPRAAKEFKILMKEYERLNVVITDLDVPLLATFSMLYANLLELQDYLNQNGLRDKNDNLRREVVEIRQIFASLKSTAAPLGLSCVDRLRLTVSEELESKNSGDELEDLLD